MIDTQERFESHLARLRALEREPASLARFPRIKRHDDVGFLQCEYRVEN